MALGWGTLSGAAINIIVAPWFQRRRGLAVSLAFNGATLGGVVIAPALILLTGRLGFARALALAALASLVALLALAAGVMRQGPKTLGLSPDGDPCSPERAQTSPESDHRRSDAVRTWRFWSVSAPFALGLAAQVGVLTHLVALVTPTLGASGAASVVSVTTASALIGRLATGLFIDRANRRLVASATLVVQIAGVSLLSWAPASAAVYAGCALFGLGVGNLTTLPALILAVEWPRTRFSTLVGMVVGINQLTFAFGPSLVGVIRDWGGAYGPALVTCAGLQAIAAALVVLGRQRPVPGLDRRPTAMDPRPAH
jgi:cyanate permease